MNTTTTRALVRPAAVTAAAALSLVLAACGGASTGSMDDHSSMTTTSEPGSPGPSAGTVDAEHNDQDVAFAQAMIVHHQSALEMARLATTRASSQDVEDLAEEIEAAQEPEMAAMRSRLVAWGAPATASPSAGAVEGMDHSAMGGEQTTALQNATGAAFDRTFLQQMIEHHTGAVQMAQTEQQQGSNPQALELAGSIVTSQSAEIEQMRQVLSAMG